MPLKSETCCLHGLARRELVGRRAELVDAFVACHRHVLRASMYLMLMARCMHVAGVCAYDRPMRGASSSSSLVA